MLSKYINFWISLTVLLAGTSLCVLSACNIIVPPDPPPEPKELHPDDFAWPQLDITQQYEFTNVPRIDCPKIESVLKASGKCNPVKLSFGSATECLLSFPAQKLQLACLTDQSSIPAVYLRMEFDESAKDIEFYPGLGACQLAGMGPAIGQTPRYATDLGFKACLFQSKTAYSKLYGTANDQRPVGLYLDLSSHPKTIDQLTSNVTTGRFDAPVSLMMDARFLDDKDRIQALKDIDLIFSFYRSFAPKTSALK